MPDEAKLLKSNFLYRMFLTYDRARLNRFQDEIDRHAEPQVLDVGAGPQFTLRTLIERGIPCVGVEPNAQWLDYISPAENCEVLQLPLHEVPDEVIQKSNVILLFHVIEHFQDPVRDLHSFIARCREGTSFIIRTPDSKGLGFWLWRRNWYPLCPNEHPSLFSRESLMQTLLTQGQTEIDRIENGGCMGETLLSAKQTIEGIFRFRWLSMLVYVVLGPLLFLLDAIFGLLAKLRSQTHEFELVARKSDQAKLVSFVIPAYNESQRIGKAIESMNTAIQSCPVPAERFEIIVVDNDSDDDTAEIATSLGARVVHLAERHISQARNTGGRAANGRFIIFSDADVEVAPDFCQNFVRIAARHWPHTGGVRILINDDGGRPVGRFGTFMFACLRRLVGVSFSVFIMRKEVFDKYGGFDEKVYAYEDTHWLTKFKILGYLGRLKRYRVWRDLTVSVSSRAAKRKSAGLTYLKHFVMPWLRYRKQNCKYWYRERESD